MKKSMGLLVSVVSAAACASASSTLAAMAPPAIPTEPVQPIIINEVMVNARDNTRDEFIELYNTSTTRSVSIGSWLISDGDATDSIEDFTDEEYDVGLPGTRIPPMGYALIVDSGYRGEYNDYIQEFADLDKLIMVTTDDDALGSGLNNVADEITIHTNIAIPAPPDAGKWPLKRYTLTLSWGAINRLNLYPGRSWERDRYDLDRWIISPDPYGCTPAVINSYR